MIRGASSSDPDSACQALKPDKSYEELHRAIMTGRFVSSVPAPLLGLPAEKLPDRVGTFRASN
jgi:hypothetical protein